MSSKVSLSDELRRLSAEFEPFQKTGGRMSSAEIRLLRTRLSLLTRLARTQEEELAVHRLIDANRAIGVEIDKIAASARERLAAFRDDNVVQFSDFQGGKTP